MGAWATRSSDLCRDNWAKERQLNEDKGRRESELDFKEKILMRCHGLHNGIIEDLDGAVIA